MRIVFAGTPEVAIPSLDAIAESRHDLAAVVTRPPAAQGRSKRLVPSPVESYARERGIAVLTPKSPRNAHFQGQLTELAPDCCPVVAYGALLPRSALEIPRYGWVNLHFSLLPAYRGAAPVQHAVRNGDATTGATTFRIVEELDAGPVYDSLTEAIGSRETTGELLTRLAASGAGLLLETLDAIEQGTVPTPQASETVSFAPKVEPGDVRIDWSRGATDVDRLVRSANPEPGAWTVFGAERFKVFGVEPVAEPIEPGRIVSRRREVLVGCGADAVRLLEVHPVGKKLMSGIDWARGARLGGDEVFE